MQQFGTCKISNEIGLQKLLKKSIRLHCIHKIIIHYLLIAFDTWAGSEKKKTITHTQHLPDRHVRSCDEAALPSSFCKINPLNSALKFTSISLVYNSLVTHPLIKSWAPLICNQCSAKLPDKSHIGCSFDVHSAVCAAAVISFPGLAIIIETLPEKVIGITETSCIRGHICLKITFYLCTKIFHYWR